MNQTAAAADSVAQSLRAMADATGKPAAAIGGLTTEMERSRAAALEAAVAVGQLVKVVNPANGAVSFVPKLAADAKSATSAMGQLSETAKEVVEASAAGAAAVEASGAAAETAGAGAKAWGVSVRELAASFGLLSVGEAIAHAVEQAFKEGAEETQRAKDAATDYAKTLGVVEEALSGVAIATYKLADARKQAAVEAANQNIAANNQRIQQIEHPGALALLGRGIGTFIGTYKGAYQAAALAAQGGDVDAAGKVVDLGNAYLAAAQNSASSQFEYEQALARARAIGSTVQLSAASRTGFATGGSLTVGGQGGDDSQVVSMDLTPGEVVNVTRGDSMGDMMGELRALRAAVDSLRADYRAGATQLARNTGAAAKLLDRWDGDGLPAVRSG